MEHLTVAGDEVEAFQTLGLGVLQRPQHEADQKRGDDARGDFGAPLEVVLSQTQARRPRDTGELRRDPGCHTRYPQDGLFKAVELRDCKECAPHPSLARAQKVALDAVAAVPQVSSLDALLFQHVLVQASGPFGQVEVVRNVERPLRHLKPAALEHLLNHRFGQVHIGDEHDPLARRP